MVTLLGRLAGRPAADALRATFVLGDTAALGALCRSAGTDSVAIAAKHGTARFPSIGAMVEADLRGWLPILGISLSEDLIERILEEAEEALGQYATAQGTVEFDMLARIVTGTRA